MYYCLVTRYRQISTDGCTDRRYRSRAAHALALFLLTTAHRQRAYPIISQMERAARFAHEDTAQTKLDKLDAVLAQSLTPARTPHCLPKCFRCRMMDAIRTLELDPQQRRQKTLEALTAQLQALSQANPVLMIFEDVHWMDPTSFEFLSRAVHRLQNAL